MSRSAALAALLLALAAPAGAAKVYVANNGVDGAACGTKTAPCRSIGAGIARAQAGDVVEVGPGKYGDLDGDDWGGGTGEEVRSDESTAYVAVDRRITVRSRDGASATVLVPPINDFEIGDTVVDVQVEGAAFGELGHGFTIVGRPSRDAIEITGAGGKAAGNIVLFAAIGIAARAPNAELADNRVSRSGTGIALLADGCLATRNSVMANATAGFRVEETGSVLDGNAVIGNGTGISVHGDEVTVRRSTIAGNRFTGAAFTGSGHVVERSSLYGNGDADVENPSCGLSSEVVITATGNYWGSALGPGHDPADLVCSEDAQVLPFATKDTPLKLAPVY
jgi:hypothetical protein